MIDTDEVDQSADLIDVVSESGRSDTGRPSPDQASGIGDDSGMRAAVDRGLDAVVGRSS